MRRLVFLCLFLAPACYDTPRPVCAFECGPDEGCPEGYTCEAESGWCKLDDAPASAECEPSLVDEDVDAGATDAEPE
jgi:hypothetical protein